MESEIYKSKEIKISNLFNLADDIKYTEENKNENINLVKLCEYNNIFSIIKDINDNMYILIHMNQNNILIPCTSCSEFTKITKTLILNYEYYKRNYGKDEIETNSKIEARLSVGEDNISTKLIKIKQVIKEIVSQYSANYKRR